MKNTKFGNPDLSHIWWQELERVEGLNMSGSDGLLMSREEGLWMSAPPADRALYDELRRVGHSQVHRLTS